MMRECVYHRYEYPDLKSRLKTYFLKAFCILRIINGKPVLLSLYGGETWIPDVEIIIGEDEYWMYQLEIEHGEWCEQRQIMIIRELK